ncbi:MAG: hypothetical protein H7066_10695, partial [Cytophagaceae bacterium]|nr:hypothetical protein [Gemmatimonadaceae bacterium]
VGRVIGQGVALASMGTAAGLLGAWIMSRLLSQVLYGVPRFDILTYAGLSAVLLGVAALASWLPARRVARIDAARVLSDS